MALTLVSARGASARRLTAVLATCAALLAPLLMHATGAGASTPAPPTASSPTTPSSGKAAVLARQYARDMLHRLNLEREMHGLRPLTMNKKLIKSAHAHNLRMARANDMSHQLPHEAVFSTRISRAGYDWRSAGENIAWNSDESENGVLYLEQIMYDEKPPDDGHRLNILSRSYTNIGIDVVFDAAHSKMWITQDFGQPMY